MSHKSLHIYYFFLTMLMLMAIILSFSSSIRIETALGLTQNVRGIFTSLTPEGWGFFTRDPREDCMIVFRYKDFSLVNFKGSSIQNLMGLSRKSRRLNFEISIIMSHLDKKTWVEVPYNTSINKNVFDNPNLIIDTIDTHNNYDVKNIAEGLFGVAKYERIPWTWRDYPTDKTGKKMYISLFYHKR